MKSKANFKKFKIFPIVVIIILLIAGLVYMNKSQENSLTPTPTPTPAPTETPIPTETPESASYQFDVHVENYKYTNDVTADDLRSNQDTRYAMYEWIYSSGYTHKDAEEEQADGCDNEFIADYIQYGYDRNTGKLDTTSNDTSTSTDTSGKVEVSPGVYSDGTVREVTAEEVENMTPEERRAYAEANAKANGFGSSMEDLGGEHITDEEFKDFMDETWNLDNPDIQDILNSGVLDN